MSVREDSVGSIGINRLALRLQSGVILGTECVTATALWTRIICVARSDGEPPLTEAI